MRKFFILYSKRVNNLSIVILLYSILLLSNFFSIQVLNSKQIKNIVEQKGTKTIIEYGNRGEIYDTNGKELASTIKKYNFWINTNKEHDKDLIASLFSENFNKSYEYYYNLINKKSNYIRIEKNISFLEALPIINRINNVKGLQKEEIIQRLYPYDFLASQALGYVNLQNNGISGIEGHYNQILTGDTVNVEIHKGVKGKFHKSINDLEYSQGQDITLTLDIELQKILQEELNKITNKTQALSANGIIINPFNGEILAISSVPSFNPNKYYEYSIENYKNKVISDSYEPGSTFKIIALSALLDLNIHEKNQKFFCENGTTILANNKKLNDHEPHEDLTMKEIFSFSSNIGMSKIVESLSKTDFYKYCKLFGFGTKTGVNLRDEAVGNLRHVNEWSKTSKTYMSIGQEISVTNLQLAMAYCAIANGGYLVRPKIIKNIKKNDELIYNTEIEVIRKVLKKETSKTMLNYLADVVENGTANNLKLKGYHVGGKTGTAQKFIGSSYSKNKFVSSFASIFPLDNPKYVLLISIDSPKYGYHWSNQSAVPASEEIIKRIIIADNDLHNSNDKNIIALLNNKKNKPLNFKDSTEKSVYVKNEESSIVPNFKGMKLKEALKTANSRGLKINPNGLSGKVIWQSMKPGEKFQNNEICVVRVKA